MLDRALAHIAARVGRLDVVVDELRPHADDLRVPLVRDRGGHLAEVDAGVVEDIARGERAPRHRDRLPRAHARAARVELVLVRRQRIHAVVVEPVLEHDALGARHIVHEGPHREVAVRDELLVAVHRAEVHRARIPRETLRNPHGRRHGVGRGRRGADHALRLEDRLVACDRRLHLHVERGAVVHVARVQRAEVEVPRALACAARGGRRQDLRVAHGQALRRVDRLRGRHEVLRGGDDGPVADVLGPAVRDVDLAVLQRRRPVPVEELRAAEAAVRVHPRTVLDMHDIRGRHGMIGEVFLDDRRAIALRLRGRHEVRHRLHVVRESAAPGVVAIVREHDEHRALWIRKRLERAELAHAHRVVAVEPAEVLRAGDDGDEALGARLGVHMLRAVRRERKRHRLRGRAAARDRDAAVVRLRRVDLVGLVRRIAVDAARTEHHGEIGARARDLLARDEGPVDAGLCEIRDQPRRERHLAREEPARLRLPRAPRLRIDLLVEREFLADRVAVDQRQERVVERELHDVHARLVRARCVRLPAARLAPGREPRRRVAELAARLREALDVRDEAARVRHLRARLGRPRDRRHRVAWPRLVRRHAVGQPEDAAQVVLGVRRARVLAQDRLPRTLVALRARLAVGPVDRLLHVPEVGEVRLLVRLGERWHVRAACERERGCERGRAEGDA